MEALLRSMNDLYQVKSKYMESTHHEIDTLILGNSHAFFGLNPETFGPEAFNLAAPSQTLLLNELILEKWQPELSNLDAVILNISANTLYKDPALHSWRVPYYEHKFGLDVSSSESAGFLSLSLLSDLGLATALRVIRSYYFTAESYMKCLPTGNGEFVGTKSAIELTSLAEKTAARHNQHAAEIDTNLSILSAMATRCSANRVELVLILMPGTESYVSRLNERKLNQTISALEQLSQKHENVRFVDFLSRPILSTEYFFDPDHLNKSGAQTNSENLKNRLAKD